MSIYANGWTRESIMEQIKKYNDGSRAKHDLGCEYETGTGNRCAVGCFIPDGHDGLHYRGDVIDLLELYPSLRECMPLEKQWLKVFQASHDDYLSDSESLHNRIENRLKTLEKI